MKPRPRLIRPLLQPIALCIAMALHAHASSAPADTPRDLDALMLSPDGDPAVFRGTFRAEQFPLLHRGPDAPPTPDGTMETDFVSNGIPPEGDLPSGVAFTPDGTKIVVAHRDTRNLSVFDSCVDVRASRFTSTSLGNQRVARSPSPLRVRRASILGKSAAGLAPTLAHFGSATATGETEA
jgi:hypothetical protein